MQGNRIEKSHSTKDKRYNIRSCKGNAMNSNTNLTLLDHFSILPDPRKTNHNRIRHELLDIIIITILAVICGADS